MQQTNLRRGDLRDLWGRWVNLKKFVFCVFVLVPNYFITGILMTLSPEIAKATNVQGIIKANIALALYFTAAAFGDLIGAYISEKFKSRRLVAAIYITGNIGLATFLITATQFTTMEFYMICAAFGLFNLWAISGTILVEQFPTHLRATASTVSLNFSRGAVIIMNTSFLMLKPWGIAPALSMIGITVLIFGLFSVWRLPESYERDLAVLG